MPLTTEQAALNPIKIFEFTQVAAVSADVDAFYFRPPPGAFTIVAVDVSAGNGATENFTANLRRGTTSLFQATAVADNVVVRKTTPETGQSTLVTGNDTLNVLIDMDGTGGPTKAYIAVWAVTKL